MKKISSKIFILTLLLALVFSLSASAKYVYVHPYTNPENGNKYSLSDPDEEYYSNLRRPYVEDENTVIIDHVVYRKIDIKKGRFVEGLYYIVEDFFDTDEAMYSATEINMVDEIDGIPVEHIQVNYPYLQLDLPNIKTIKYPKNLIVLDGNALGAFSSIKEHTNLPESLLFINSHAFSGRNITKVVLPKGVKKIPKYGFSGAKSLVTVECPGVEKIGACAFLNCVSLKNVKCADVNEMEARAFDGCTSLVKLNFKYTGREVNTAVFRNCVNFKSFDFSNIEYIRDNSFRNTNLSSVTFSKKLTLGPKSCCFADCRNLKTVTVNSSSFIAANAFKNCKNLSKIFINNYKTYSNGKVDFDYVSRLPKTCKIYAGSAKIKKLIKEATGRDAQVYVKVESPEKLSASGTSKAVTLKWTKVSNATGYRVYIFNEKTQKYDVLKTIKTNSNTFTIKALKPGTYKFAVKAYRKIDGDNSWSAAVYKTFKIK